MSWTQERLFSSKNLDWVTPDGLWQQLDAEFGFGLDAAASVENTKCSDFFTEADDALTQDWSGYGTVWCNPPYGRNLGQWMMKCALEGERTPVVALVFARTDTRWCHDWGMDAESSAEIRFIRGRVKFTRGNVVGPAPAPSMVVVWAPKPEAPDPNLDRMWVTTMYQP